MMRFATVNKSTSALQPPTHIHKHASTLSFCAENNQRLMMHTGIIKDSHSLSREKGSNPTSFRGLSLMTRSLKDTYHDT